MTSADIKSYYFQTDSYITKTKDFEESRRVIDGLALSRKKFPNYQEKNNC